MAIEIVGFPIKNGDFPWQTVSSPEGKLLSCSLGTPAGDFALCYDFTSPNVAKLCWLTWWFQQTLGIYQRHTNGQWIFHV